MGSDYSKYLDMVKKPPGNICVIHACPGDFYGINLNPEIINGMQEIYSNIWSNELRIKPYGDVIVKFKTHKLIMYNSDDSKNSAKAKQMFCRFHKMFCNFGWSLISSPTLTFELSLSSWYFYKDINPFMVKSGGIENEFCLIGLSSYDKLQFVDFPSELENPVIECIRGSWSKGIQNKQSIEKTENAWTLQLNGLPWSCHGEQSLDARFLVLSIIRFMSHNNWRLVNSTAMKPDASDTMFFRRIINSFEMTCPETMPEYYFMLALMGNNYFCVLGGDQFLINVITESCKQHEKKGVHPPHLKHNYPAIEMISDVWSRRHEKEMETRRLITLLFQDLANIGWLPIESIDCTRSVKDLSSLTFVRIPPVRMLYFCLCPKKYNGICLINAIDEVQNIVFNTFVQFYAIETERVKRNIYGIAHSIDFHGEPFKGRNVEGVLLFQLALAAIISALKEAGWYLVVSADTSNEVFHRDKQSDIKWSIYGLWFSKVLLD